jgi:integrase
LQNVTLLSRQTRSLDSTTHHCTRSDGGRDWRPRRTGLVARPAPDQPQAIRWVTEPSAQCRPQPTSGRRVPDWNRQRPKSARDIGIVSVVGQIGRRDHAMLLVAVQTGLRVSELTRLRINDIELGIGPNLRCHGKGRKDRATPLTRQTVDVLREWLAERGGTATEPVFPTRRGTHLSRDAVERLVTKYAQIAARTCPSLAGKNITPHVLRHSAAMALLHSGVDITVIALWLGHESPATTRVYLHADMAMKEQALARMTPPSQQAGRYTAPDALLAFLKDL